MTGLGEAVLALTEALAAPASALALVARLAGLAVLVATIELVVGHRELARDGLWAWALLRREHAARPALVRIALDAMLGDVGFTVVLGVRVVAGFCLVALPGVPWPPLIALACALIVAVRLRGRDNGASDAIVNLVLLALAVPRAAIELVVADADVAVVAFVAAQALLSYFAAGVAKLREPAWRAGSALHAFASEPRFGAAATPRAWLARPRLGSALTHAVLAWELAAPLALASPAASVAFCVVGLAFHVGNHVVFGLNRFVFAWLSTYPAVVCCAVLIAADGR